jgi:predicted nuclease with TOPRIM domain
MKAIEIKSELDKTQSRIEELETERERQTIAVEAAQKAFIDGKADAAKLNDAQGKLSLYERTIESLRATYQKLKFRFESESADQNRRDLIKQMVSAANDVGPLYDDYLEARNEFHNIITEYAETLISKAEAYQLKQAEYQKIMSQTNPPITEAETQLTPNTKRLASATYFNHPPLEYDRVIVLAEQLLKAKISTAAQKKRQAEYNAQTREREARQTAAQSI